MTEHLFSYGTLQDKAVQLANFGRVLKSEPAQLTGYAIKDCLISDPKVLAVSAKTIHPIACYTGNNEDIINGRVFTLTKDEILKADSYEVADYKRIICTLSSGQVAWVYVKE